MKLRHQNGNRPKSGLPSIKTAGNTIINNKKAIENKDNLLLINDIQKTPGNGLWCVNLDKNRIKSANYENIYSNLNTKCNKNGPSNSINPNIDLELEVERKIISQLKYQVQDLTTKLYSEMSKCAEAEYKAERAENTKQNFLDMIEKKTSEAKELEEKTDSLENTVINLNEALGNARKEINRLQMENQAEMEKSKKFYEMYQNLMIDKERKESALSAEINNLNIKLQFLNSEKESILRMKAQTIQNSNNDNLLYFQKLADDKENTIKLSEILNNKLSTENAELKRKLLNEENLKTKLNEIIKKKKSKIERIKEELKGYKELIINYNNDVKWNQDLVLQRDTQLKVYKEKIKKLEENIDKLTKANQRLKSKKNANNISQNKIVENNEEMYQVKAKPFLFGPETDDI